MFDRINESVIDPNSIKLVSVTESWIMNGVDSGVYK